MFKSIYFFPILGHHKFTEVHLIAISLRIFYHLKKFQDLSYHFFDADSNTSGNPILNVGLVKSGNFGALTSWSTLKPKLHITHAFTYCWFEYCSSFLSGISEHSPEASSKLSAVLLDQIHTPCLHRVAACLFQNLL